MTGESGAVVTGRLALAVSLPGLHAACFSRQPPCPAELRGLSSAVAERGECDPVIALAHSQLIGAAVGRV
jgi:hypothetical protein